MYVYMYVCMCVFIYISICVCVCVCVVHSIKIRGFFFKRSKINFLSESIYINADYNISWFFCHVLF